MLIDILFIIKLRGENNLDISKVSIKNYKIFQHIEVSLSTVTALIGDNNSGKTSFLEALTLPLSVDEIPSRSKKMGIPDFNEICVSNYLTFISENIENISSDSLTLEIFSSKLPCVEIRVDFNYSPEEHYLLKSIMSNLDNETDKLVPSITYRFNCRHPDKLFKHVKIVLSEALTSNSDIKVEDIKNNLLPIEFFDHSILVTNRNISIPYDIFKNLKYNFISTDRDDFSSTNSKLGSKSLVNILNNKLTVDDKITLETKYGDFFDSIKTLSNMENILNWQESSHIENASDFFDNINVMPNMPQMNSLLNSVKLGYNDRNLSELGLGYRNLVLLVVLINSLLQQNEYFYSLLTIEEPEAHLSNDNQQILKSYLLNATNNDNNVQILYSTHDINFINKLKLENIVLFHKGFVVSLKEVLNDSEREYLVKNPNLDLFKIFYSKKVILVEGITEEFFIKSYLHNLRNLMTDIQVLSFHKGYTKILDIWLKLYKNSGYKIGIIRDYDDEDKALESHEKFNIYDNICIRTTEEYTLEPEIVKTGNNFELLNNFFHDKLSWEIFDTEDDLANHWRKQKSDAMFVLSQNLNYLLTQGFLFPKHISDVLIFLGIPEVNN